MVRIGEVQVDPVEAFVGERCLQNLHGVVMHHAHVGDAACADLAQGMSDARRVHLDTQKVMILRRVRHLYDGVAIPRTNFQHAWGLTLEDRVQIQHLTLVPHPKLRPVGIYRALLSGRHAPFTADVTTNGLVMRGVGLHGEWIRPKRSASLHYRRPIQVRFRRGGL